MRSKWDQKCDKNGEIQNDKNGEIQTHKSRTAPVREGRWFGESGRQLFLYDYIFLYILYDF